MDRFGEIVDNLEVSDWNRSFPSSVRWLRAGIMYQGNWISSTIRVLLLIVMSIQGFTPDLHDIASHRAMILLCPSLLGPSYVVEDDSPDDVCEYLEFGKSCGALREANQTFPSILEVIAGPCEMGRSLADGILRDRSRVTRLLPLHYQLLRLLF